MGQQMKTIAKTISEGAVSFLMAEYLYMAVYIVFFSGVLMFFTDWETTVSFIIGAITSILCGWIGMQIAVYTNVRTAHECWKDLASGFKVAIQGGCVMGLSLVSFGVLALWLLVYILSKVSDLTDEKFYEAIAGYGLGGSSIALFGRVGGGIYTKAADVGADLSGKNEWGLEEDDYRNPACIADNVGDNVGDIAGMGADLFGSFAESTCAALVIAGASGEDGIAFGSKAMMFPVLLSSTGIISGLITMLLVDKFYPVNKIEHIEKALKGVLNISTLVETPFVWFLANWCLPSEFRIAPGFDHVTPLKCTVSVWLGLWSGLIIGYVTEYYTSHSYTPVRDIAKTQEVSAATGII